MVEAHVKILEAARSLAQRQTAFVTQDILSEILDLYGEVEYRRHAVSTYLTHIQSRCCANAPKNHQTVYNYLWRVRPGVYRLFDPTTDQLHPTR